MSTKKSAGARAAAAGLVVLTILEVLGMGVAGLAKFQGPTWIDLFESWGYAGWFALFIGAVEVLAALALLVPSLTSYAALTLIGVMLGAIWTVTTNETQLGPGIPAIHIAVLSVLLTARWSRRWRPRRPEGLDADLDAATA